MLLRRLVLVPWKEIRKGEADCEPGGTGAMAGEISVLRDAI